MGVSLRVCVPACLSVPESRVCNTFHMSNLLFTSKLSSRLFFFFFFPSSLLSFFFLSLNMSLHVCLLSRGQKKRTKIFFSLSLFSPSYLEREEGEEREEKTRSRKERREEARVLFRMKERKTAYGTVIGCVSPLSILVSYASTACVEQSLFSRSLRSTLPLSVCPQSLCLSLVIHRNMHRHIHMRFPDKIHSHSRSLFFRIFHCFSRLWASHYFSSFFTWNM